jgi:hypothetical protein
MALGFVDSLLKIYLGSIFFSSRFGVDFLLFCSYSRCDITVGCWWLTSLILATQEAEIRRITIGTQLLANSSWDPILKKTHHKEGLVEWLKV